MLPFKGSESQNGSKCSTMGLPQINFRWLSCFKQVLDFSQVSNPSHTNRTKLRCFFPGLRWNVYFKLAFFFSFPATFMGKIDPNGSTVPLDSQLNPNASVRLLAIFSPGQTGREVPRASPDSCDFWPRASAAENGSSAEIHWTIRGISWNFMKCRLGTLKAREVLIGQRHCAKFFDVKSKDSRSAKNCVTRIVQRWTHWLMALFHSISEPIIISIPNLWWHSMYVSPAPRIEKQHPFEITE